MLTTHCDDCEQVLKESETYDYPVEVEGKEYYLDLCLSCWGKRSNK